jgi:hypothetical protein
VHHNRFERPKPPKNLTTTLNFNHFNNQKPAPNDIKRNKTKFHTPVLRCLSKPTNSSSINRISSNALFSLRESSNFTSHRQIFDTKRDNQLKTLSESRSVSRDLFGCCQPKSRANAIAAALM